MVPLLGTHIHKVARERTLLEFNDKWNDKIGDFLHSDHLQQYLSNIVTGESVERFEYDERITSLDRTKQQILTG